MVKSLKLVVTLLGCVVFSTPASSSEMAGYMGASNMQGYGQSSSLRQVELNKTEILRLGSQAGAVIIGNPYIADVSVHASNTLLLIGRGYGETNLIVLDQAGQTLINSTIQVVGPKMRGGLRLYNGTERETYNCTPDCQPAPVLGDNTRYMSANKPGEININNDSAVNFSQILNSIMAPTNATLAPPTMSYQHMMNVNRPKD